MDSLHVLFINAPSVHLQEMLKQYRLTSIRVVNNFRSGIWAFRSSKLENCAICVNLKGGSFESWYLLQY